jgi:hypothetical protein
MNQHTLILFMLLLSILFIKVNNVCAKNIIFIIMITIPFILIFTCDWSLYTYLIIFASALVLQNTNRSKFQAIILVIISTILLNKYKRMSQPLFTEEYARRSVKTEFSKGKGGWGT